MLTKEEFKDVFDNHFDAVRNFAYYRCGDIELASDIAQDVFMKVWEKRFALNSSHLKPLLIKMAADSYISSYRRARCHIDFEQSLVPDADSESTPHDELVFNELAASYAKALEQMTERQRTIFLMSREEGMKYAEIANCLDVSVKAVEKLMSAALQLLRTKISY